MIERYRKLPPGPLGRRGGQTTPEYVLTAGLIAAGVALAAWVTLRTFSPQLLEGVFHRSLQKGSDAAARLPAPEQTATPEISNNLPPLPPSTAVSPATAEEERPDCPPEKRRAQKCSPAAASGNRAPAKPERAR